MKAIREYKNEEMVVLEVRTFRNKRILRNNVQIY